MYISRSTCLSLFPFFPPSRIRLSRKFAARVRDADETKEAWGRRSTRTGSRRSLASISRMRECAVAPGRLAQAWRCFPIKGPRHANANERVRRSPGSPTTGPGILAGRVTSRSATIRQRALVGTESCAYAHGSE